MTEDDLVGRGARLGKLPCIDLVDYIGYAVIVEARTGVAYQFAPEFDEGPALFTEGFLVPVLADSSIQPKSEDEAFAALTYRFVTETVEGFLSVRADPSRERFMIQCLPVLTEFGAGWMIWNFQVWEGVRLAPV